MITAYKSTCPIQNSYQANSLSLADLATKASASLPTDFQVLKIGSGGSAEATYIWDGSAFVDDEFNPATSPVTGTIRFVNPSSTDISFAW
jgi:hypothetical protein